MHDPCTVAHEIKYPWRDKPSKFWPKGYRQSFITIWHVDPERPGRGGRSDDSCGWSRPPTSEAEREFYRKIGREEYSDIFGKLHATQQGKDYAYICYEPSTYDAIYWAWRRIKREQKKRSVWKYGSTVTWAEEREIYELASSPVDNLRLRVANVKSADDCGAFFVNILQLYKRFHRPWYRHPRWHVHHWRFQVHPWQLFKRWAFDRCAGCGRGFRWGEVVWGYGGKKIFHDGCDDRKVSQAAE